ncbi:TetR/AcrR family transcriptional regulator [Phenylobacterium sp.]|uniref:TetR/AcrR family transcriptional regulator n=1 Tax=Phenylobacterium sp. TaxID=1871053 RepID=UPI00273036EE|nr:TetR/AcrR family transcriptional regulator [Phenylobacterium sp.]MDP1873857.1 helix-turn-helix domain-containing protein [Phenylobacterium sp.]MDP3490761.1 helix-turn-helix domain-containing protein [Phenylobacterium sp.]
MDARTYPAKETPKSRRTRARILDAAMRLFAEIGYHAATNALIAEAANLTRGAMLYHFSSREELVEAAVAHIEVERARLFEQAASSPASPGVDAAEHAIDAYWSLLHETPFVAFAELEAAARTDPMLRARLANAQSAFDRNQVGERFLALTQAGSDPRFQTSRDLGRFLLEGLARGSLTYDEIARRERLLAVVKRAVRALNRKGEAQDLWVD